MSNLQKKRWQKGRSGTGTLHHPDAFNEFVKFYALPDPDKAAMFNIPIDPKTGRYESIPNMGDFALKWGISRETLRLWKNRDDFQAQVSKSHKDWGKDKVGNVMASLYTRCMKYGLAYDVELFLAYYADWRKDKVEAKPVQQFGLDDIRALMSSLPPELQAKFYATITSILIQSDLYRSRTTAAGDPALITSANQGPVRG